MESGRDTRSRKQKAKKRKGRRSGWSRDYRDSSTSSGESSSEDNDAYRDGEYWNVGAKVPGLPSWIARQRSPDANAVSAIWGAQQHTDGHVPCRLQDFEDPPGVHLSRKVRERILNGFYVDLFTLLKPEESGKTGTKRDKKGVVKGSAERNFNNWLSGYTVYMSLVGVAFPERTWHLMNHFNNVLKARALAGDMPGINYDEAFHQRASHYEMARWDFRNNDLWLETVGLHSRAWLDVDKRKFPFKRDGNQRVCWEYNQGRCQRYRFKYEHVCEVCFGYHTRLACQKSASAPQPFRGSRPSNGGKGRQDGSSTTTEETATTSKQA